ncbi:hypothetical protein CDD83_3835 [Cordyceps sp. RAO-2017]|nr:hypothetical protein CDD83_3835 [Cordyceps sp. RAO-2017]
MSVPAQHQRGGLRLALIMAALCMAVVLTGMDQTILATATPVISNEFRTLQDLGWWTNAYLLTLSSFQLFYGKLYSLFSIKLVYLAAIAIFEAGTLICTLANNSVTLIIGRAVAGLGAAGIFSGGILITTKIIPLARRAVYLGVMSGAFGLAAIVGPFLGGVLADRATWRWCFGINLPLGAVTVVLCVLFVHTPVDPSLRSVRMASKMKQLDIPGIVCMVASSICLLMALQSGGSMWPWSDRRIIALLIFSAVLAVFFVLVQTTSIAGEARTIPPSLSRNRDVWLAAGYAMCTTGGVYVPVLYLPVWFQTVRGQSALVAGAMLTPLIASYVACSVVAGALTTMTGYYNPGMIIGTALAIAGAAVLTTLNIDASTARAVGYQLLYGFGIGFAFGQPSYVVQTLLPEADVPVGVTFITLVQNLSASVFVAVAQSIFQGGLRSRLRQELPGVDLSPILDSGLSNFRSSLPQDKQLAGLRAFSASLVTTFYISLALSAVSAVGALGIRWVSMKPGYSQAPAETSQTCQQEEEAGTKERDTNQQ